ncbi:glycerol-3-phosphate 1-O-acyltransferase PlsY [Kiritimatiella glycovorans]|uniref:Glycerol-3-phosphate acyltransferase n=1 Tax=Kiritimatiella glycovorans TaxID=1307763 RepID=A0A0G3EGE6_9BACT|nr:glycerol-3-phosphate 1-O-acyltransferase PlsY [Kiritimatiella glycovorans]AKJ65413.1 G3P acyltransferase [Kiritimatiella glycovorans]
MATVPGIALLLIAAYLLGGVPFGLLVARRRGVDLRAAGSGNTGATNVFRSVGRKWGVLTFLLDALKGFLPAFLFPLWTAQSGAWGIIFGAAAVLGHNFSPFLGLRGGKGVATSAGVLLGAAPAAMLLGLLAWTALFFGSGFVSLASIGAALTVALAGWFLYAGSGPALPVLLTLLAALAVWRHRSNIARLRSGTEHRFHPWRSLRNRTAGPEDSGGRS